MSVQRFGYKNGNKSQFVIKQSKMSLVTHPIKLPSHVDSPGPAGPAPRAGGSRGRGCDVGHET